jgi:hypothetical protein
MDDALKDRAKRYRDIAAEVRMVAGGIADPGARQGMLMAADVWDRLAGLAECPIALSTTWNANWHVRAKNDKPV